MPQIPKPLNQNALHSTILKKFISSWLTPLLLFLLSLLLVLGLQQPTWGQFTVPGLGNTNAANPPQNVIRRGDIEVAPVQLDGTILFFVTAPTVRDRSNPNDQIPVETRAELIEFSLRRIIHRNESGMPNFDFVFTNIVPEQIKVGVATLNNETIISARTNELENPQKILTVTETDARFYGMTIPALAEEWRERIQDALRDAARERSPEALKTHVYKSLIALLILAGVSVVLYLLQRFSKQRVKALKKQFESAQAESELTTEGENQETTGSEPPSQPPSNLNRWLSLQFSSPKLYMVDKRIKMVSLGLFLLTWGQVAIWLLGGFYIFNLFPWTRIFAWQLLGLPIYWLIIWFVSGLVNSLGDFALKRLGQFWHHYPIKGDTDLQRRTLRIGTALTVLGGLKTTVVYGVALGLVIGSFGIPIGSVIAIGGFLYF